MYLSKKTIFVIEDDFYLQKLEAEKLTKEGFNIEVAANYKEVDKIIEKQLKIDLILLDLMLPDINGFEVLKNIRKNKNYSKTPVVIFTNLSEKKDIEKAKAMGISEYLVKSNFDLEQLIKKVKELTRK